MIDSTEQTTRLAIVETCRRLAQTGLVYGTAGNVSARLGDRVFISPTSVPYETLTPEQICEVSLSGAVVSTGGARPSSEVPLHLSVYAGSDARAVVHVHSRAAVAAGLIADEIPAVHYVTRSLGGSIRVADYACFGSEELAAAVSAAMDGRSAALMRNHGAVASGATLDQARERCETVEWVSDVFLRARAAGTPAALSSEQLDEVTAAATHSGYRL